MPLKGVWIFVFSKQEVSMSDNPLRYLPDYFDLLQYSQARIGLTNPNYNLTTNPYRNE